MKLLPTVVASARNSSAIVIDDFEGIERATDRDAFDLLFRVRATPVSEVGLLVVRFSGTVIGARSSDFGLPPIEDRKARFRMFSEAAIGDALDDGGEVPIALAGQPVATIDCFSPHFQMWHDRPPATDHEIETYLTSHLLRAWEFNLGSWEFGSSDLLRLKRSWPDCFRIISLHDGHLWTLSNVVEGGVTITPLAKFIRDQRQPAPPVAPPEIEVMAAAPSGPATFVYVDESRIADLRSIERTTFDLRKLIALCEELNQCYRGQCYHAVAALTRAVIDHVPPIFGCRSFAEVANNYAGSRSFKDSMRQLETSARAIGDQHLHTQIRDREVLPSRVQVDFSQVMDVLLAEITRILSPRNGGA